MGINNISYQQAGKRELRNEPTQLILKEMRRIRTACLIPNLERAKPWQKDQMKMTFQWKIYIYRCLVSTVSSHYAFSNLNPIDNILFGFSVHNFFAWFHRVFRLSLLDFLDLELTS